MWYKEIGALDEMVEVVNLGLSSIYDPLQLQPDQIHV